jgi:hypothetical protein
MGSPNEQNLIEGLIIESIKIYGKEMLYIPRKYVSKDEILGEDRMATFEHAYPIPTYFENIDSFNGQGAFMQKFGYMLEQQATISVPRKSWQQLVGNTGNTILPDRPAEGDLLYFPLTKGLFEIKFVTHQNPFYQIGKLYVYRLELELFQYSSETFNTGIPEIDVFETLKSYDPNINPSADTPDSYGDNDKISEEADTLVFNPNNPFGNP